MKKKKNKSITLMKSILHSQQKEDGFFDGRFRKKVVETKKKYKRNKEKNVIAEEQ